MTLCDAGGTWLESIVLPANTGERAGALLLFEKAKAAGWSHNITLVWADEGLGGVDFEAQVRQQCGSSSVGSWTLESKSRDKRAFVCSAKGGSLSRSLAGHPLGRRGAIDA